MRSRPSHLLILVAIFLGLCGTADASILDKAKKKAKELLNGPQTPGQTPATGPAPTTPPLASPPGQSSTKGPESVSKPALTLTDTVKVDQERLDLDSLLVNVLAGRGIKLAPTPWGRPGWADAIDMKREFKESDADFGTRFAKIQSQADSFLVERLGAGIVLKVTVARSSVTVDNVKGTVAIVLGSGSSSCSGWLMGFQDLWSCLSRQELSQYAMSNGQAAMKTDGVWIEECNLHVSLSKGLERADADDLSSGWFKTTLYFTLVPNPDHMSCYGDSRMDVVKPDSPSMRTAVYLRLAFAGARIALDKGKLFFLRS